MYCSVRPMLKFLALTFKPLQRNRRERHTHTHDDYCMPPGLRPLRHKNQPLSFNIYLPTVHSILFPYQHSTTVQQAAELTCSHTTYSTKITNDGCFNNVTSCVMVLGWTKKEKRIPNFDHFRLTTLE